jgi:hypothetical protein
LSRWYDVDFFFANQSAAEKRFTGGNNVDYFAMKGICLWMGVLGASGVRGIYAGRRNVLRGLNGVSCDVEGCGRCCGGVCDDGFAGVE